VAAVDTGMARVVRSLQASTDTLIERQLDALKAHPHYAELRELDLRQSARRNVSRAVLSICGDALDDPEHDSVASTVMHIVPDLGPEEVVSAYRLAMAVIRDAFIEEVTRFELPADMAATGLRKIWELTDHYSDLLAAAHGHASPHGQPHRRTRALYLKRAFCGDLKTSDLELASAQLGLSPDVTVRVFRVRVAGLPTQRLLRHAEAQALGWPLAPLVTRIDHDFAGLSQDRCQPLAGENHLIAVSEPVTLSEIHQGYVQASQILDTARRFELHGVISSADLGLRSAILAMPATSQELMAKYVSLVEASTPMAGDLLHTVETFLQCQRRFQHTAQILNMHVNSLRHRLERYREISGADLADTETVAEVWWALQYRRALETGTDIVFEDLVPEL
jgi:PucR C-terminal helix-turn-helix domain